MWNGIETICELGSQVPVMNELVDLFHAYNLSPLRTGSTAKDLYLYLGAKKYTSIDFNGEYGSLPYDLNYDLRLKYGYHDSFDLVTNFGTGNVVFNQLQLFKTIHDLCRTNGVMIHTFPTQGWGHKWFYRHDISFVEDLASANNYEILFVESFFRLKRYLQAEDTQSLDHVRIVCDFIESLFMQRDVLINQDESVDLLIQREIDNNRDLKKSIHEITQGEALFNMSLAVILRKRDSDEFEIPILNMYKEDRVGS